MTPEELGTLFDNHTDCYADTWTRSTYDEQPQEGPVIPAMTKERFVSVLAVPTEPDIKFDWQGDYCYVGGKIIGHVDPVCDVQTGFSTGFVTQYIPEMFGERIIPVEMDKTSAKVAVHEAFRTWYAGIWGAK